MWPLYLIINFKHDCNIYLLPFLSIFKYDWSLFKYFKFRVALKSILANIYQIAETFWLRTEYQLWNYQIYRWPVVKIYRFKACDALDFLLLTSLIDVNGMPLQMGIPLQQIHSQGLHQKNSKIYGWESSKSSKIWSFVIDKKTFASSSFCRCIRTWASECKRDILRVWPALNKSTQFIYKWWI